MIDKEKKPHIFKWRGYWRVSHTPRTPCGRENQILWVQANGFAGRLNQKIRPTGWPI